MQTHKQSSVNFYQYILSEYIWEDKVFTQLELS